MRRPLSRLRGTNGNGSDSRPESWSRHPASSLAPSRRGTAAVAQAVARRAPLAVTCLALLLLAWLRLIALEHGLWNDEAFSALEYIGKGPAGIFSHYIPNDHLLFELLAWVTTKLAGNSSEPVLRFWSVVPAIAAGVLFTLWLWRRLDPWIAAVFAVLAAAAPLYWSLSVQARGYGLAYLAGVLMVIGLDTYVWRRRRQDLLLFAGSAVLGIWSLPVFVLAFVSLVALLFTRPGLRRQAVYVLFGVGILSFLFYLPVLGSVVSSSRQRFGTQLPWYGVVSGPLKDLLSTSVTVLLPHASLTTAEVVGGLVVAVGFAGLWLRPERLLALALLTPTVFCYAFLEIGRLYEADRFVSFLELPLLALCAVALVWVGRSVLAAGRLVGPPRRGYLVAALLGVGLSLYVLDRAERVLTGPAETPIENFKELESLVSSSRIGPVVSNSTKAIGFDYYFGTGRFQFDSPARLEKLFCSNSGPFVYLEHGLSPLANVTCLRRRGAIPLMLPQSRSYIAAWFVTAALPGQRLTALAQTPVHPINCPAVTESEPGGAGSTKARLGQPFAVDLRTGVPTVAATVRVLVTGTRLVPQVPGAFTARGSTFVTPGQFLIVRYRIFNQGPATVEAEQMLNSRFGIATGRTGVISSPPRVDKPCSLLSTSYAVDNGGLSAYTHIAPGSSIDTVAAYPLPSALATPGTVLSRLTWSSPTPRLVVSLPRPPSP